MQVQEFLEQSARKLPDKKALVIDDESLTYHELDTLANRLATALLDDGLVRGDRIVIQLENSIEAVVAVIAALKADGTFVVVNPQVKPDKLAHILDDSRASALVSDSRRTAALMDQIPELEHLRCIYTTGQQVSSARGKRVSSLDSILDANTDGALAPVRRGIDIDLAALIYTSGSTGRAKGVMLTHLNIVSAATSIATYLANTVDDVILSVLPLAFDYGLYQVLMAFKIGGTVVLERGFNYPHCTLTRIAQEQVTGFPIVPTIAARLLQMDLSIYDFSSLRYMTNTAAALSPSRITALRKAFPHVAIYSMYGLTECKRVSYLPPDQIDVRPTSVGRGMPNEEVYIVDEHGQRVGPGIVGELVVRGANVMKGYWERPEETARVLRPGVLPDEKVLYTGDLFRTDEEGYLYFVGRRDDIIKTRGEKVSPREIEDVILTLEGVVDVVVAGVPDADLGEAIKAVIQLNNGYTLTVQEVRRHCRRYLEDFMIPTVVEFSQELPTTMTGKVIRRATNEAIR